MTTPTAEPKRPTVAVVGASADRSKFGNISVRAHRQCGYEVFPVNPRGGEIEGLAAVRRLRDVPVRPKRITSYVPPAVGATLLDEIAAVGCDELWLNPGSDSPEIIARARALGLNVRVGCSISALGISPDEVA